LHLEVIEKIGIIKWNKNYY